MKAISGNRNNLNKSVISFKKKQHIKFFTSFNEMNEADAKEMALLTPQEHLQNAVFLIKKIFAEELKKPMNKRIKFK